jgi:hypothetical protein
MQLNHWNYMGRTKGFGWQQTVFYAATLGEQVVVIQSHKNQYLRTTLINLKRRLQKYKLTDIPRAKYLLRK